MRYVLMWIVKYEHMWVRGDMSDELESSALRQIKDYSQVSTHSHFLRLKYSVQRLSPTLVLTLNNKYRKRYKKEHA